MHGFFSREPISYLLSNIGQSMSITYTAYQSEASWGQMGSDGVRWGQVGSDGVRWGQIGAGV